MDVTLPNGQVISDVPDGTTQSELLLSAAKGGLIDPTEARLTLEKNRQAAEHAKGWDEWFAENLDLPGGITGGVTGAVTGATIGGPVGGLVGGIIGGAVGTFGGSLASDALTDQELDYERALKEAAISVGFDLATLGAGKALKPFVKKMFAAKIPPAQALKELQNTQQMLTQGGATLTPYQAGNQSYWSGIKERIANLGYFSSGTMRKNAEQVDKVFSNELDKLLGETYDPRTTGSQIYEIITEADKVHKQAYGDALEDIYQRGTLAQVTPGGVAPTFDAFLRDASNFAEDGTLLSVSLSKETMGIFNKYRSIFDQAPRMDAKTLLKLYKDFNAEVAQTGLFGHAMYNPKASSELAQLSSLFGDTVESTLRKADPKLASEFASIQSSYKDVLEGLLPKNLKPMLQKGNVQNFEALGRIISKNGSTDAMDTLFRSLDTAYAQLGKNAPFPKQMILDQVRSGYILELLPKAGADDFASAGYTKLFDQLSKPAAAAKARRILGQSYKPFMGILKAMQHANISPSSHAGELVLHSKQFGALSTIVGAGAAGVAFGTGSLTGLGGLSAGLILGTPYLFAKLATNPKYANKMLMLSGAKPKSLAELTTYANMANDIVDDWYANDGRMDEESMRILELMKMEKENADRKE